MTETYVQELCNQLESIATIDNAQKTLTTKDGKVSVNGSLGTLWRKLVNTEDESRKTTLQGIEKLLDTINDLVASKTSQPLIQRNVVVKNCSKGKVLEYGYLSDQKDQKDVQSSAMDLIEKKAASEKETFFVACDTHALERLQKLSLSLQHSCKGMSVLASKRYYKDDETVAMLLDLMNYASLISKRIDEFLDK